MFKNILIPTDGSDFSEKVVAPGLAMAKAMNARVTALHVFPTHHISPYGEFGPSDDIVQKQMRESATADANKYLDRVEAAAKAAGVVCDRVIVEHDDPWKGIIDTAKARGCDLVMMAAHGRRGLAAMMLGSETNKVLMHSSLPVLVFR